MMVWVALWITDTNVPIPIEIFNYDSLDNVVNHYWGHTKYPLTESEEICLDAVLSTGLTRKQGISKNVKNASCPSDSLLWILGYQLTRLGYYRDGTGEYSILLKEYNDPGSVATHELIPLQRKTYQSQMPLFIGLSMIITSHRQPDQQGNLRLPPGVDQKYNRGCYGLVRDILGQNFHRTNDLLRLLSGHLPEPPQLRLPQHKLPLGSGAIPV